MSTSVLKVKNPATGEWEEIQAIVGPTGPAGPQGKEGPAGKNAYQYAQDKGYTGTEEEFATKLVENNEIFYVTMTPIEGQDYSFTSDKTAIEVIEAYNAGKVVKCKIDFNNFPLVLPLIFVQDNVVAYSGIGIGTAVWVVHSQNTGTLNSEDYVTIDDIPAAGIPAPATASVGQTIVVKAVDENGKPTEWEAADLPSGAKKTKIITIADITAEADIILSNDDTDNLDFGDAVIAHRHFFYKTPEGDQLKAKRIFGYIYSPTEITIPASAYISAYYADGDPISWDFGDFVGNNVGIVNFTNSGVVKITAGSNFVFGVSSDQMWSVYGVVGALEWQKAGNLTKSYKAISAIIPHLSGVKISSGITLPTGSRFVLQAEVEDDA